MRYRPYIDEDKWRDENAGRRTARRIEREHPNWIIHYGIYTKEYVAFPRFRTPEVIRLESRDPENLGPRMRDTEQYLGLPGRPPVV